MEGGRICKVDREKEREEGGVGGGGNQILNREREEFHRSRNGM